MQSMKRLVHAKNNRVWSVKQKIHMHIHACHLRITLELKYFLSTKLANRLILLSDVSSEKFKMKLKHQQQIQESLGKLVLYYANSLYYLIKFYS